jgi:hypothetical protein
MQRWYLILSQAPSLHEPQLEGKLTQEQEAKLQDVYLVHPDRAEATNGTLEDNMLSDASGQWTGPPTAGPAD